MNPSLIWVSKNTINTFCTCISVRKDSIVILCWFSSSRYMSLSWRHSSSSADETFVSDAFSPIVPSFRPAISLSLDCRRKDLPFLSSCFAIVQFIYNPLAISIRPEYLTKTVKCNFVFRTFCYPSHIFIQYYLENSCCFFFVIIQFLPGFLNLGFRSF